MKEKITQWLLAYPLMSLNTQYGCVKNEIVLWNHKPLRKGSFLVWDVENISMKSFEQIKSLVKFTPEKLYALSKRALSETALAFFRERGFMLFENYPATADEKIISLIKVHQGYTHLILISSDSDFVPSVHRYLEEHHVQWIINDANKKRICMRVNLCHPRLCISVFAHEGQTTLIHKPSKKKKPLHKKSEAQWMRFFKKKNVLSN